MPTNPRKYFNKSLVVRVSYLEIFVPPALGVRNKQPLSLCAVRLLQTVLSRQDLVRDRCRQFRPKLESHVQDADSHFVQRTCKPQTSINRLTAPPSVAARPAILSSRDRSIAGYS